ncbi:MAG TPA: tripartite tricarboxylate transporter substrate-binding protein [Casimicrobiaceae bacterium]|nr:tripartite tricarboxylate transporter substrate-binding protein [Casimicrobiaceae bacterium]
MPHLASGKLRALAVTGNQRLASLPDVPTLAEHGIRDLDVNSWWGLVGPAGLPRRVVDRLHDAVQSVLDDPELRKTLADWSIVATGGTSQAFADYITREWLRWQQIAVRLGIAAR